MAPTVLPHTGQKARLEVFEDCQVDGAPPGPVQATSSLANSTQATASPPEWRWHILHEQPCGLNAGPLADGGGKSTRNQPSLLAALDLTLKLFGYDDPASIQPAVKRPVRLFGQHELKRLVLDIQREHPELTKHKDIALEVIRRKEWDADAALVLSITYRVKKAKKRIKRGGAKRQIAIS
jgi:hypothetical protein